MRKVSKTNPQPCGGKCKSCVRCKIEGILATRLAAITPEQFIAPLLESKESDVVIGVANDRVKRLVTLEQLLSQRWKKLLLELSGVTRGLRHRRILKEKFRITAMSYDFLCEKIELELNNQIIELELNNPDPVTDKPFFSVRKDWSICKYANESDVVFG